MCSTHKSVMCQAIRARGTAATRYGDAVLLFLPFRMYEQNNENHFDENVVSVHI